MRLAVIADIHGNFPALEAVLADIDRNGVDELIVLGDYADRGPFPLEVVRCLMACTGHMILGNTDLQIIGVASGDVPPEWLTHRQFASMRWTASHLDSSALHFLSSLPPERVVDLPATDPIRVLHGSLDDISGTLFPHYPAELADAFARIDEPVLLCGHSHLPWIWADRGRLAVNPGSVGQPFNGDVRAQYALLDWDRCARCWRASLQAVEYDRDSTRRAFTSSGYLDQGGAFARISFTQFERARATIPLLLTHAWQAATRAGVDPGDPVPDQIWERAAATYNWGSDLYWDPVTGHVFSERSEAVDLLI